MTEVPWEPVVQQLHDETTPWGIEALVRRLGRRLVRSTAKATHRWVLAVLVPQIEEHATDPAARWDALKAALRARSDRR